MQDRFYPGQLIRHPVFSRPQIISLLAASLTLRQRFFNTSSRNTSPGSVLPISDNDELSTPSSEFTEMIFLTEPFFYLFFLCSQRELKIYWNLLHFHAWTEERKIADRASKLNCPAWEPGWESLLWPLLLVQPVQSMPGRSMPRLSCHSGRRRAGSSDRSGLCSMH